jgi:hypothetical protein
MLSNNAIIIGVVVVLVVIVAAYYFMSPATDDTTTPAPAAHSTPAASGYTYVVDADVAKTGKYWDTAAANVYKCPTGYTSKIPGYCILPTTSAAAACSTDTKCLGYLTSSGNHLTISGDPNYAQLTTGIGPSDLTGVTYYRKTKST